MSGASENPDLAEVKAVLRRLQRLDVPGPGSADAGSPRGAAPAGGDAADARARMSVFDRKRAAAGRTDAAPQKQSLKLTYLAKPMYLAIAGALIAAVAIVAFYELPQSQPELREVATTAQGITAAPEPARQRPQAKRLSSARQEPCSRTARWRRRAAACWPVRRKQTPAWPFCSPSLTIRIICVHCQRRIVLPARRRQSAGTGHGTIWPRVPVWRWITRGSSALSNPFSDRPALEGQPAAAKRLKKGHRYECVICCLFLAFVCCLGSMRRPRSPFLLRSVQPPP